MEGFSKNIEEDGEKKQMALHTIKRNLESRMPGNSHVWFGAGVQFPGLHHTDDARKKLKSIDPIYHFENESSQK